MRLIQYQWRALEQVVKDDIPTNDFILEAEQEYFLNNSVVFLAGISDGISACSDMRDIYVAVFTKDPNTRDRIILPDPTKHIIECRGAVLLRTRERDESSPEIPRSCLSTEAVDGLRVIHKIDGPKRIFFRQNGKTAFYVKSVR